MDGHGHGPGNGPGPGPDLPFGHLKKLIEIYMFEGSSPRQPLGLAPAIFLHYSISILDGFEPDF